MKLLSSDASLNLRLYPAIFWHSQKCSNVASSFELRPGIDISWLKTRSLKIHAESPIHDSCVNPDSLLAKSLYRKHLYVVSRYYFQKSLLSAPRIARMAMFSVANCRHFRVELIGEPPEPSTSEIWEKRFLPLPFSLWLSFSRFARATAEVTKKGSKRFTRGNFRRSNVSAYRLENSKY